MISEKPTFSDYDPHLMVLNTNIKNVKSQEINL